MTAATSARADTPDGTTAPVVTVRGLTVALTGSGRVVASDIDLDIHPGEILGLVGESGSGKTTVGSALLGYVRKGARIAAGSVTVAGVDVLALRGTDLERYRGRAMAYMPQDPASALNPALRIGTQLTEVLEVHEPAGRAEDRRERVLRALADVDLPATEAFLRRFPHQLSGGQQQRVCLAMAFLLDPPAIMLDEPTTGLDVTTQARVLDVVRELCRVHRTAALYITHDLAVVATLADRVAVMSEGRIVETGDASAVLRSPREDYTKALVAAVPDVNDHPDRAVLPPAGAEDPDSGKSLEDAVAGVGPGQVLVAIERLRCAYGAVEVVKDVSLDIRSGECVALVGESGSGKSTLSTAVIGLMSPSAGSIRLAGHALAPRARDRSTTARRALQYIFQNPYASLNPRKTIGQAMVTTHRHFYGGGRRSARADVLAVLQRVGLTGRVVDKYPEQLSGGERQRVAIGRALLCQPRVLICDEVTSALDVSVQAQILDLLQDLQRERGLSLLFVTHNLAVVRSLADRVAVLEHGQLVEVGETDATLDRPRHPYTQALLADTPSWTEPGGRRRG